MATTIAKKTTFLQKMFRSSVGRFEASIEVNVKFQSAQHL